ncbi:hypothetical protein VTO42DRAFT_1022 [Malbranchea cinnamomea]
MLLFTTRRPVHDNLHLISLSSTTSSIYTSASVYHKPLILVNDASQATRSTGLVDLVMEPKVMPHRLAQIRFQYVKRRNVH